jgi:hypothetical protein
MISEKDYIVRRIRMDLERAQERIAKFSADIARDAAYALSWSTSVFEAAAEERVLKQVLRAIDEDQDVMAVLTDSVLCKARYPAQSSSPTSNLIEQYELAALARVLSTLRDVVAAIEASGD